MAEDTRDDQEKAELAFEKQVDELNELVKVRVARSKIHGVGLVAMRDIKKGEKLYADITPLVYSLPYSWFGRLREEVRQLLLERFPMVPYGSAFMFPDTRLQAYINHSNDPNYDAENDVMVKDVKKDEEITEDYKKIATHKVVYPWL